MATVQRCDMRIQNRAILSKLGVTLWADRHRATIHIHPADSQPTASTEPPQAIVSPVTQPAVSSIAAPKSPKQIIDTLLKSTAKPKPQASTDAPSADVATNAAIQQPSSQNPAHTDAAADAIEFHLQAILYRDWLILVDVDALDTAGRELWLSLNQAIKNQAERTGAVFIKRQLDYPLFPADIKAASVSTANTSLKGFIFGSTRMVKQLRHVAILSSLPDFLMLDSIYQITIHKQYQISDMLMHADIKKQFWQLLHSSSGA